MDPKIRDAKIMPIMAEFEQQKKETTAVLGDEKGNESESLLSAMEDVMSKGQQKTRRTVHWKDSYGNKLAEVMEFQPSDASDSDEEEPDSCFCTIM